jgi:hypothetical protein
MAMRVRAVRAMGVAARTVSNWHSKGLLKGYRIPGGGQHRRFRPADVLEFIVATGMPVPPELAAAVEAEVAA